MTAPLPVIIVGAGMAAYAVAREFRKLDKTTPLLLLSSDQAGSYAKPMLSNALAMGKDAAGLLSQTAAQMAATLGATIVGGVTVTAIDSAARTVACSDGSGHAYRDLVLALGATPIRLALKGDGAASVLSVNHLDDYATLRQRLATVGAAARVTILGAGLIGCEFADDLVAGGHQVTLVDPNARPLAALAAPALSAALLQAWTALPIKLHMQTTALAVRHAGAALQVDLADGSVIDADVVLSAVGLRPAIALASETGLACGRGIQVDAFGATSAEGIYALGDCAEYHTAHGGAVLPYVAPLLTAARAIGATLAGTPTAIVLKNDAVVVKTASLKLALAPPPAGSTGRWIEVDDGERIVARFVDDSGIVRGFGLTLHTPALRNALMGELDTLHQGAPA